MKSHAVVSFLIAGCLAVAGTGRTFAQELYYGDDSSQSPEEYYLEGIGYGTEDYASYAEDTSYTGLYSPSASDSIYGNAAGESGNVGADAYTVDVANGSGGGYALPASPSPGSGAGTGTDAGDWFSMSGVALMEAVGNDQAGRVLITRDGTGRIEVLKAGETRQGAFKVVAVGSEQARVEPADGGPSKVVPILHRPVPLDSLMVASARLQGLRIVIGAKLAKEVAYDPSMLQIDEGFSVFLADQGLFQKRFDDVVVVRSAPFLVAVAGYDPEAAGPEGENLELAAFRTTGDELLEKVGAALPRGTEGAPDKLPAETSAFLGATPAAEALHYLNLAWGSTIKAVAPAPSAKAPGALDPAKAERLYTEAVGFARQGEMKEAGRRLLWLCRNGSKDPEHFLALGKVYWKLGRTENAVRVWKKGLALDPDNSATRALLVKAREKVAGRSS